MNTPAPSLPPEFSHPIDVRQSEGQQLQLSASENERAALAKRFDLVRIDLLQAELVLTRKGRIVEASGTMRADFVQSCAVSAEDIAVHVEEPLALRFVPERGDHSPDAEIELDAEDCDEIDYAGTTIDPGEAVAQSLGLAIDPFLTGPAAQEMREKGYVSSPESNSPFAALKGLKSPE